MVCNMTDKEPERYYDWMLWKIRQEDAKMNDTGWREALGDVVVKKDEGLNLDPSGNEQMRRELVAGPSEHFDVLKEDMRRLTSDYYGLINRIKELSEENNELKKQIGDLKKKRIHNY